MQAKRSFDGMCSEITATNCSFHGRRPAGSCPVPCEEDVRVASLRSWSPATETGALRVGGAHFLDQVAPHEGRRAGLGKALAEFAQRKSSEPNVVARHPSGPRTPNGFVSRSQSQTQRLNGLQPRCTLKLKVSLRVRWSRFVRDNDG